MHLGGDLDAEAIVGRAVPSMMPGMVLNWRRTSSTMASAALPTLFMVMALNQYGNMAPTSRPAKIYAGSHKGSSATACWCRDTGKQRCALLKESCRQAEVD